MDSIIVITDYQFSVLRHAEGGEPVVYPEDKGVDEMAPPRYAICITYLSRTYGTPVTATILPAIRMAGRSASRRVMLA